tara:strand:- start:2528 stop:4696 length:2169 start_codon:yes stop_codon:yes gene_type:complete
MNEIFSKFKKSNVAKAGSAYVLVAWALIELSANVLPTFNAPDWVAQSILFILLLGFPITVVVAWAAQTGTSQEAESTEPNLSSFFKDNLFKRLIFVGGPSAAIAGVLTLYVFPTTNQSDIENITFIENPSLSAEISLDPRSRPVRSSLILGETRSRRIGLRTEMALSDDGSRLVFNSYGETGGINMNLLELDSLNPALVQDVNLSYDIGYCNCGGPSFSPDGEWIMYVENSFLQRVRSEGSAPQRISEVESTFGAHWAKDNSIIYTDFNDGMLYSMTSAGRSPELIEGQNESSMMHSFPHKVGISGAIIYTVHPPENVSIGDIYLLDPNTSTSNLLIEDAFNARYASSGHIVFIRDGSIWAVPFDNKSLRIIGEEVPVVTGIETWAARGISNYDFSDYGRLVYLPGEQVSGTGRIVESNLIWLHKSGLEEPIDVVPQPFSWPQISPDGNLLAVTIDEPGRNNSDIWIYDFERKTLGKRTFSGSASLALWSRDGGRLFFRTTDSSGVANGIWAIPTNGTGSPELVTRNGATPFSTSSDDTSLIFSRGQGPDRGTYAIELKDESSAESLILDSNNISNVRISPNGDWVSYVSIESGISQIYVQPYPEVESGKWQVSTDGGSGPTWSSDSRYLYYIFADQLFEVANLSEGSIEFSAGLPQIIGELSQRNGNRARNYDAHPTDEKFLFMQVPEGDGMLNSDIVSLVMVENWFEDLKRLAPVDPNLM